jgi:diguanylate cyclase (GGDEF)-like protein
VSQQQLRTVFVVLYFCAQLLKGPGVLTLINALQPLYLVNIAVGLTLTLCVAFVAAGRERDLMVWAAGFGLYALAFVFFGLRTELPNTVSVIGGNASMALMFALFTDGLCRLYGFKISRLLIWALPLLAVAGFALLRNNFEGRIVLGIIVTCYHSVLVTYLVTRSLFSVIGRGKWIIFSAVATYALLFLIRAVLVGTGISPGDSFLEPGMEQAIYFTIATVTVIMFAFGLLVNYKERAEHDAWRQAHHDPLTSIGNRRVLQQRLQQLAGQQGNGSRFSALMLLDLDHFKELNDKHGHALGDQLLTQAAGRLKNCISAADTVVRLGGDEFVVLLEALDDSASGAREKAWQVANRIRQQLCEPYQLQVFRDQGSKPQELRYEVTASIGIEIFRCAGFSRENVLRAADVAMYQAKQAGRNAIHCGTEVAATNDTRSTEQL